MPLAATYPSSGTKRVKVRFAYLDSPVPDPATGNTGARPASAITLETRMAWFDLTVWAQPPVARYGSSADFDTLFNAVANPDYYASHLGATVNVRFGVGHTRITKPFIVVEGYNTSRLAPHLVGENNRNNDVNAFLRELNRAAPYDFNDNLQQAGYDLIYIDFTEGTDDIRRNALVFEEVLKWANGWKQRVGSAEQNVVMGQSMGGLVARYGLARLVRGGYNPQTRLLVLHDSPQRGAYSPMGLQALTRQADFPIAILPGNGQGQNGNSTVHIHDLSDRLREALLILNAPATKQLAIKSVTGIDDEYEDNTFIDGPYKTMVDFADLGGTPATFPPIVATSDGSQCGRPQNTPPHQELTRNDRSYLLNPFILAYGIQSEAIANALPAYGTQDRIAHLRLWFTLRIIWLHLDVTLLNRNYTSPANTLPYETLPGGSTNLSEQYDLIENSFYFTSFNYTTLYNGDLCFVPSYSALDVPTVSTATAYAKYISNATDNPSKPRVARYIAQEGNSAGTLFNLPHLRFTARNSEWIFKEMQRPFTTATTPPPCDPNPECPLPAD